MVTISGYVAILKNLQNDGVYASCDKKKTACTRVSAADTFDLWQVTDGAHGCVQLVDSGVKLSGAY